MVSEIVGYQTTKDGKRPASRIDPLQIENNVEIYARQGGGWTSNPTEARKNTAGQAVRLKPSEINHGNVTPSFRHEDKAGKFVLNHGGVTLAYAEQQTVLSLSALRRLRFPVNGAVKTEIDLAARSLASPSQNPHREQKPARETADSGC